METKSFRVAGLPTCYHTNETKEVFERCANGSITELVTSAIVSYAEDLGFTYTELQSALGYQPNYISDKRFAHIQATIDKSRHKDYTYLVAFEYLLNQHPGASKSWIQRQAVLSFC